MKQPFEKVVEEHGGTVLRVCRVIVGVHDAQDAWSETFLAALRSYPDLPDDANAEAWLVTCSAVPSCLSCSPRPKRSRSAGSTSRPGTSGARSTWAASLR
ncbi:MAG: RNA polymerase sigma factor [Streptosporangiaceae bacterium]